MFHDTLDTCVPLSWNVQPGERVHFIQQQNKANVTKNSG